MVRLALFTPSQDSIHSALLLSFTCPLCAILCGIDDGQATHTLTRFSLQAEMSFGPLARQALVPFIISLFVDAFNHYSRMNLAQ
ncbi:hypothetical protein BLOT_003225 [Blomia tropicalis]|nr:hypothetical protein BLOT_003225 [Blomia tropicalis]